MDTILIFLGAWFVVSVPSSLVIGKLLSRSSRMYPLAEETTLQMATR